MKLESLKSEKFGSLSMSAMQAVRGGGTDNTTGGKWVQIGNETKYAAQDYKCITVNQAGYQMVHYEYLVDGKWQ